MSADPRLRAKIGTPIIGADGKRIGDIDGVVLNPTNRRVRQILVRKGTFLHSDRTFSVHSVTGLDDKGLHVGFTADDLALMDHHRPADFMTPGTGAFVGTGVYIAVPAERDMGVMSSEEQDMEASDDRLGMQQLLLEFRRGATVVDKDGKELGKLADLAAVQGGKISALRVDHGRFRHHTERWIPEHLVYRAYEEQVELSVPEDDLEQQAPADGDVHDADEGLAFDTDETVATA